MTAATERILVIRLGALGDIVLCFQAFHEIRQAHPKAEIAFLTTSGFVNFARSMPWFNRVLVDPRPSKWRPGAWFRFAQEVRNFGPTRVYDLQGKRRQSVLYAFLGGPLGPTWSGAAPFCSHPRLWPPKPGMHFIDFLAAQLRLAGVAEAAPADLTWLDAPHALNLPARYAVLIPGCSQGQEHKRWPARNYAHLAQKLQERGIGSVVIGTHQDAEAIAALKAVASNVVDISGQTSLAQLAGILRRSSFVVGNDTGPTHLAATVGTPALFLLSNHTDPAWSASRKPSDRWLRQEPLHTLQLETVLEALSPFM